jgi:NAD(P)H-dependent flavin oxidoreductase YrpB (nitropropane dioxygenase family)
LKLFNIGNLKIPVPIIQGGMGIVITLSALASVLTNRRIDVFSKVRNVFAGQNTENLMLKMITK